MTREALKKLNEKQMNYCKTLSALIDRAKIKGLKEENERNRGKLRGFLECMGTKSDRTAYKPYGRRQKIGIYCTKAQKIEIELEFEFYRNVFYEELSTFMDAFIQAQKIFPEDAPVGDYDEFNERDMKIAFMATGIERRSRAAMIEESEAGNEKTKTTGS